LVLPLLFSGVHSPTVWRPPCVWHEIKAHEYHNNQSLGVLLRPRSFVGLLHLRPTGQRPPSHLHIFGRRPPSHLHIFGSWQACLYCLRHDPRRATSSSTGTTRRQPLQQVQREDSDVLFGTARRRAQQLWLALRGLRSIFSSQCTSATWLQHTRSLSWSSFILQADRDRPPSAHVPAEKMAQRFRSLARGDGGHQLVSTRRHAAAQRTRRPSATNAFGP